MTTRQQTGEETADSSAVQVVGEQKGRRKRARGHVTVFGTWCKGCGLCIEFCPQGVFEANGQGRPVVAHEERCTACHWCDTHCPDMAITVRRLDEDELEELEELIELAELGALPAGSDLAPQEVVPSEAAPQEAAAPDPASSER